MEVSGELAKYGVTGIAVALVGALVWIITKFLDQMNKTAVMRNDQDSKFLEAIDRNTKCSAKLEKAVMKNTSVTEETVKYLKHRNGTFEKLIKEQPLLHQLVKEHFTDEEQTDGSRSSR